MMDQFKAIADKASADKASAFGPLRPIIDTNPNKLTRIRQKPKEKWKSKRKCVCCVY